MNNSIKFLIDDNSSGKRVDIFLTKILNSYTRSHIKKLIEAKHLKINGISITSPSTKLKNLDKVAFELIQKNNDKIKPKKIKLDIVYEDNDVLIINKPKGMVVHPGAGNYENTLVNGLLYKYRNNLSNISGNLRPGIVHRIDKDTSGLLIIAKNNFSHANLGRQFSEHTIKRKYQCLIWGIIRPLSGKIETLISRNKKNRKLMTASEISGKKAITNYTTIKVFNAKNVPKISLLECELETGRTHQIRVHLKFKGTSILGDKQYGKKNQKYKKICENFMNRLNSLNGQALHAQTLEFEHPTSNKILSFKTNLPSDFRKMLDFLNNLSG